MTFDHVIRISKYLVSTFFHPANRPIDFVKSFLLDFFINSVRVRVRVEVRVSG